LDQAHYLLRPLMLRRLKSEVETKLPPRRETKVVCPLATIQRRLYCQILRKDKDLILDAAAALANDMDESKTSQSNKKFSRLRNLMMQLRKCCCHPFLFPAAEEAIRKENLKNGSKGWDGTCDETIVTTSGKMIMLDRLLSRLKLKGHRVVIFSQFTRVLDIIDDYLNMRGYKFARLDGSTNRVQRMIHIHEFNKDDSLYFAMIMSTRAGGMGINLQTADTVILMDSDWNPQSDLQAMARVRVFILDLSLFFSLSLSFILSTYADILTTTTTTTTTTHTVGTSNRTKKDSTCLQTHLQGHNGRTYGTESTEEVIFRHNGQSRKYKNR
jgi:SWI/SNF-related matrix-associated actin-dependent regulator of chromatin subfamily A member 5